MATIIDALVVTLGLDPREYEKKSKQASDSLKKFSDASAKQSKLIAEQAKTAAKGFSALKVEVLGALAAFGMGAGFKAFIADSMNAQATTGRWSSLLKVSGHDMQAWEGIAKGMGGSAQDAVQTMQSLASGFTQATLTGNSPLFQASRRYGFNIYQDPIKTLNSLHHRMLQAVQAGNPEQAEAIGQAAGVHAQSILFFLMQSGQKYQEMMQQMMAATGGMTKQSMQQAEELQWRWALLQMRFERVGLLVFDKLEPTLEKLGKQLAAWIERIDWNKVITAIGNFIDKVQQVVKEMGGWKTIAEILGGVLALKVLAPIITMTAALARMVPLFAGARIGVAGLTTAFGSLGLAVAAAAGAGGVIGHEIWKHLLEGTKAGDATGSFVAHTLAALGDKNAQEAVNRMNGHGPVNHSGDFHPERTGWYKSKEDEAVQYFQSQGFSRNAAIGMAANIAVESTFNQRAVGDHGQAYGIGQWHPDRQANFARVMGLPIQGSSYQQQLAFYAYEVKHNKRLMSFLSQNPTAGASAMLVSKFDERPADVEGEMQRRALVAQGMANAHIGAPSAAQVAAKAGSTTTNTNAVTINGPINVQTQAKDANGVAMGIRKAFRDNPLIAGSVTALA